MILKIFTVKYSFLRAKITAISLRFQQETKISGVQELQRYSTGTSCKSGVASECSNDSYQSAASVRLENEVNQLHLFYNEKALIIEEKLKHKFHVCSHFLAYSFKIRAFFGRLGAGSFLLRLSTPKVRKREREPRARAGNGRIIKNLGTGSEAMSTPALLSINLVINFYIFSY